MTRLPDESIPPDEALYRSIGVDDVVGADIMPSAVDLPRCSFNRSSRSEPSDVFVESRPQDTGIVEIIPAQLPPPVPRLSGNPGAPYEFYAADDPTPENDAHCEVRIKPQGATFSPNHKVRDKVTLAKAKDELVRKLRVHTPPR